jgi:hypothetical protein
MTPVVFAKAHIDVYFLVTVALTLGKRALGETEFP